MAVQVIDLTYSSSDEGEGEGEGTEEVLQQALFGSIPISRDEISILTSKGWLNDEIINAHMYLLYKSTEGDKDHRLHGKWHYFSSFFYDRLMSGHAKTYCYGNVRRWTKRAKVDIFTMSYVVIPINLGNYHWALAYLDFRQKELVWCDSMVDPDGGMYVLQQLFRYLQDEYKDKKASRRTSPRSPGKKEKDLADDDERGIDSSTSSQPGGSTADDHSTQSPYDAPANVHDINEHKNESSADDLIQQLSTLNIESSENDDISVAADSPSETFEDWTCIVRRDLPQQRDGSSCGLFLCKFASCVVHGDSIASFSQTSVQQLRRYLIETFRDALDQEKEKS